MCHLTMNVTNGGGIAFVRLIKGGQRKSRDSLNYSPGTGIPYVVVSWATMALKAIESSHPTCCFSGWENSFAREFDQPGTSCSVILKSNTSLNRVVIGGMPNAIMRGAHGKAPAGRLLAFERLARTRVAFFFAGRVQFPNAVVSREKKSVIGCRSESRVTRSGDGNNAGQSLEPRLDAAASKGLLDFAHACLLVGYACIPRWQLVIRFFSFTVLVCMVVSGK